MPAHHWRIGLLCNYLIKTTKTEVMTCSTFRRHFTLPHGVNGQKIDARYRSGVLEVQLPKTEQAKGKRVPVTVR